MPPLCVFRENVQPKAKRARIYFPQVLHFSIRMKYPWLCAKKPIISKAYKEKKRASRFGPRRHDTAVCRRQTVSARRTAAKLIVTADQILVDMAGYIDQTVICRDGETVLVQATRPEICRSGCGRGAQPGKNAICPVAAMGGTACCVRT